MGILSFGPNFAKSGISGLKQKNHAFVFIHGEYLLYQTFLYEDQQAQHHFIVSSPSGSDTISPKKSYGRIFLINLGNLNCGPFTPKYKSSPVIGLHEVLQIKNS